MKDYRYALSNLKLNDDVYANLVQDALADIASKTGFFKKSFYFDVTNTTKQLDFAKMAFSAETDVSANTTSYVSGATNSGVKMKSFLSVVDILYQDTNMDVKPYKLDESLMGKEFKMITGKVGLFTGVNPEQGYYKRNLCIYSYVPQTEYVSGGEEDVISSALIAKLRFDAFSMFYEAQDGQFIVLLEKIYNSRINALKNTMQMYSVEQSKNIFGGLI